MENIVNDPVFGEMIYDGSWEKKVKLTFWSKELEIRIAVRAYSEKDINDAQRTSYKEYQAKAEEYNRQIPDVLLAYYKENYEEIDSVVNLPEKCKIENITKDVVIKMIKVKTIFFAPDGRYGYLCDCVWDPEHGIAVIFPCAGKEAALRIGDQDELI